MVNAEDFSNKRGTTSQEIKQSQDVKGENRQIQINSNSPEIMTNPIYTPGFLRTQIGKLMRIEFLIGTNNLTDRIGFLEDVGASYILLRSFEGDSEIYADIYAIKFITISSSYMGQSNFQNYNNMNTMNNMGMHNMNTGMTSNMNRYY